MHKDLKKSIEPKEELPPFIMEGRFDGSYGELVDKLGQANADTTHLFIYARWIDVILG